MKKVALYIRVSTREQTEGYSIDAQKDKLVAYAKSRDYIIHNIYIDGGFSGANIDRPALSQLLGDINKFDVVVAYKLDRLSRSQKDTLYLIEDIFLPNNIDFISISESFDTSTPFGKAMVGILSVFAQLEREQIKERMMLGREGRAKEGKYHGGGQAPIGYDYIEGNLVVNEYEAIQVKEVARLYLDGYGANSILNKMNQQGYKHKYGDKWSGTSCVYNILFNPVYLGKVNFNGNVYEGEHEAILSEDISEKIKFAHRLRTSDKDTSKCWKAKYLLTGLLFCKRCGSRYAIQNVHQKRYYNCYSVSKLSKKMIKDPNCTNHRWKYKDLDEYVISRVFSVEFDDNYLDPPKEEVSDNSQEIIKDHIKDIDKRINKLLELYQIGDDIPLDNIGDKLASLQKEKKKLKNSIAKKTNSPTENIIKVEEAKEIVSKLKYAWDYATLDEKREILFSLIRRIEIDGDLVDIQWKFNVANI